MWVCNAHYAEAISCTYFRGAAGAARLPPVAVSQPSAPVAPSAHPAAVLEPATTAAAVASHQQQQPPPPQQQLVAPPPPVPSPPVPMVPPVSAEELAAILLRGQVPLQGGQQRPGPPAQSMPGQQQQVRAPAFFRRCECGKLVVRLVALAAFNPAARGVFHDPWSQALLTASALGLQMWAPTSGFRMPLPLLGSAGRAPGSMPPAVMSAPSLPSQLQPQGQPQQQLLAQAAQPAAQPHAGVAAPGLPQQLGDGAISGTAKRKADVVADDTGSGGGGGDHGDTANKRPATGAAPPAGRTWLQY
jgi:hypothetical protein